MSVLTQGLLFCKAKVRVFKACVHSTLNQTWLIHLNIKGAQFLLF